MMHILLLAVVSTLTGLWSFTPEKGGASGAGEYRRALELTAEDRDNLHMDGRAYLELDGVWGEFDIIFNGERVCWTNDFHALTLDVTKLVKKNANEVVIRVKQPASTTAVNELGLLRPSRFRVSPHPHPLPGTLTIDIEALTAEKADLIARYETPWGPESKRWTVAKPRLWTVEDPYRYELDIYGFKFSYGIRQVSYDEKRGLVLNGRKLPLKGVDFDSTLGPLGLHHDDSALRRQLLAMKAKGVNAIRTCRTCPAPQLLDLCDEMGLVVLNPLRSHAEKAFLNHPADVTDAFSGGVSSGLDELFRLWRMDGSGDEKLSTSPAVALRLSADPYQPEDPQSLRFLSLEAVDRDGARVAGVKSEVSCAVSGPGELVAVGAFGADGRASVIVRRTGEGVIGLTVRSEDLVAAQYTFGGVIRAEKGLSGLEAARKAVRAAKAKQPNEPWTVLVPTGEVCLGRTLVFGPEDAGRPGAPVVWKAEGVTVRGGVDVGPWTEVGPGVVAAAIPVDGEGRPRAMDMLFVNGERASRSVLPKNRGSFKIPGGEDDSRYELVSTNGAGKVTYAREYTRLGEEAASVLDAVPDDELADVQMQVRMDWTQARRRIVGWNRTTREVFTECFGGNSRATNNRWCDRAAIRFENVRSAFVELGEWFYDRKGGRILYRLRNGETAATLKAVTPAGRLSKLLVVDGAHDLRFEGLAFAYADAPQGGIADDPKKNNQTYRCQSAGTYDATVHLENAVRVEFRKCRVAHTGNYAFRIADGCREVALRRCETWDTGAGGVWIGASKMFPPDGKLTRTILKPEDPRSCAFNVVEDCRFRHGGRFNPEGTAIFVTHASDCRIEHNEIDDWYYSGITVGYTWGYKGSVSQRNRIAYNRISRLGQHELSDMGGIYTLATSFGTVVCNNVITDVFGYDTAAWGLYADEGSEGIVFENNVVSHTEFGGINQHFGSGCIFRNNIVAYNDARGCLSMSRREAFGVPSQVNIVGNIFYTHKGPLACKGSMEVDGIWAHNVWWKEGGPAADDFDGRSAKEFLASGRAYGDVVSDPLFVDAKRGNFRLKPDSPALKLGFREWDTSLAGPRP